MDFRRRSNTVPSSLPSTQQQVSRVRAKLQANKQNLAKTQQQENPVFEKIVQLKGPTKNLNYITSRSGETLDKSDSNENGAFQVVKRRNDKFEWTVQSEKVKMDGVGIVNGNNGNQRLPERLSRHRHSISGETIPLQLPNLKQRHKKKEKTFSLSEDSLEEEKFLAVAVEGLRATDPTARPRAFSEGDTFNRKPRLPGITPSPSTSERTQEKRSRDDDADSEDDVFQTVLSHSSPALASGFRHLNENLETRTHHRSTRRLPALRTGMKSPTLIVPELALIVVWKVWQKISSFGKGTEDKGSNKMTHTKEKRNKEPLLS